MTSLNCHKFIKRVTLLLIIVHFNGVSQETETISLEMRNDTIIVNNTTIVDSTKNSDLQSYEITSSGDKLQLVKIDNTLNRDKQNHWLLMAAIFLFISTIILLLFNMLKKVNNRSKNSLTLQEENIVRLISLGKTNLQISEELYISKSTVKTHINNIYRKLNISSRNELKAKYT